MLIAGASEAGTLAAVITGAGVLMIAGAAFLLLAPGVYGELLENVLEGFDSLALRALGVLGAGIGVAFLYAGATAA